MPRLVTAAAVLFCICLFFAAPAAADTVLVSTLDELTNNLTGAFTDRTIVVTGNINAGDSVFVIGSGKNITLMPGSTSGISINRTLANGTINWGMFTIQSGGNLTLAANATNPASTLTIDGGNHNTNTQPLVWVQNRGYFTLEEGLLTNNRMATIGDTGGWGGGVRVTDSGTFMMTGGEISGNTANNGLGDGVRVMNGFEEESTFTMTGNAEIAADNELYIGSGVYVGISGSTFTGSAGNISGDSDVITPGYPLIQMKGNLKASDVLDRFALRNARFTLVSDENDKNLLVSQSPLYQLTVINGDGSGSYAKDETVQISAIIPSGKTFDHWETIGVTLASPTAAATTFVMPENDVTATAVFKGSPVPPVPVDSGDGNMENAFRVLFDTNGGSTVAPATGLSYGDKITAPANPVRDGYTFGGWYKDAACTQGWSFSDGVGGDMTLYAKWSEDSLPVATTAAATTKQTPAPAETRSQSQAAATTAAPAATTAAAGVSPTVTLAPAPVLGALLGLLAAGILLRRKD